jgi:hypothetical protein
MLVRGDGETDAGARLRHYVQAVGTAPAGSAVLAHARRKRAAVVLAMASGDSGSASAGASLGAIVRHDLIEVARDLEALGDAEKAAEAYARAGDVEGEARALARAGDVDRLDALLFAQQTRDREVLARRAAHEQIALLVASGRRREAADLARAASDEAVRERGRGVEARRVADAVVAVTLHGEAMKLALGDEVVVGRTATISVASAAVSRHHVAVRRRGADVVVCDLGSRNGTLLRSLALAGEAVVGDGIELRLGKEVPLVVRPAADLPLAVSIEVCGERYVAPLGPARLGVGAWRLEQARDGWVELVTDDDPTAFADALQLASRVTLLGGDAIARERSGTPVLRVDRP